MQHPLHPWARGRSLSRHRPVPLWCLMVLGLVCGHRAHWGEDECSVSGPRFCPRDPLAVAGLRGKWGESVGPCGSLRLRITPCAVPQGGPWGHLSGTRGRASRVDAPHTEASVLASARGQKSSTGCRASKQVLHWGGSSHHFPLRFAFLRSTCSSGSSVALGLRVRLLTSGPRLFSAVRGHEATQRNSRSRHGSGCFRAIYKAEGRHGCFLEAAPDTGAQSLSRGRGSALGEKGRLAQESRPLKMVEEISSERQQ